MNKICFIFIFLISFAVTAQQKDKEQILKDSKSFITALEKKDYNHFLDLMYPTIFEYVNKEKFLELIKSVYEGNDEYSIEIIDAEKIKFTASDVFTDVPETKYAFVSYPLSMKMIFLDQSFKDEEEKKMMKGLMELQGMKVEFINDNTIKIEMQSMTIAINDKVTGNKWKYLNHEEDNPHRTMFVSATILKKAKDYYYDFILNQKENGS
ncbi:hypothetical protein [Moheibacter sediminis]|uniref:DUF4468 domain-containing protein n=1 Tax=Moheibacter sediminis TaxID=1434700 RepID=A0A1W1ZWW6_9FLAO|nr:hypothetical protein [Moheibacter sediminis]SMC52910.1 hypothetical protein SAMN06296427_103298 [Moheibacter sediminis]